MLDAIGAGQEAHHLNRLERGGPGIDRVGTDVADGVGAQRHGMAVAIEAELGVDDLVEGLEAGRKVLHAIAGPFDRAPEMPRGGADENLLGVERALAAEAAADVGCHHAQPVARQVERLGQRIAHDAGNLRRGVEREGVAARLVFGEARARLDRDRGLAAHPEAGFDPHRRRLHHGVDVAALELAGDQHVGARLLVQERRPRERGLRRIDDGRQRLEIDGDELERVLGEVAAFRHHAHHRLADIADLAACERKDRRGVVAGHARRRQQRLDEARQILGGEHRHDARRRPRGRAIDRPDAGVRMIAAPERDVQHARHLPVVDEAAEPGEEARVLGALDARADDLRPRMDVVGLSHRRRHPCAGLPIAPRHGRRSRWRRVARCA